MSVGIRERQSYQGGVLPCLVAHRNKIQTVIQSLECHVPVVSLGLIVMRTSWVCRGRGRRWTTAPIPRSQPPTLRVICQKMALLSQYGVMIRCGIEGILDTTTAMLNRLAEWRGSG